LIFLRKLVEEGILVEYLFEGGELVTLHFVPLFAVLVFVFGGERAHNARMLVLYGIEEILVFKVTFEFLYTVGGLGVSLPVL